MKSVSGGKILISVLTVPLTVGLVAAPALAYPPGNKPEVFVKKSVFRPGKAVQARAVNIKPGCAVTFIYDAPGRSFDKRVTSKANRNGVADATLNQGPRRPGKYRVVIRTGGNGCPPGRAVTTFKVAKKTPAKG